MDVHAHTPEPGEDDALSEPVENVFNNLAQAKMTEGELKTIQFHYERDDLSSPVYILFDGGKLNYVTGFTSSKQEAEIHMKRNPAVSSYISSEALLNE